MELERSAQLPIAGGPQADLVVVMADERTVAAKENLGWVAVAFDGLQGLSLRGVEKLKTPPVLVNARTGALLAKSNGLVAWQE